MRLIYEYNFESLVFQVNPNGAAYQLHLGQCSEEILGTRKPYQNPQAMVIGMNFNVSQKNAFFNLSKFNNGLFFMYIILKYNYRYYKENETESLDLPINAIILAEWLKELSAICQEHTISQLVYINIGTTYNIILLILLILLLEHTAQIYFFTMNLKVLTFLKLLNC